MQYVPRDLCALVHHVSHAPRAFVPHVSCALRALVPRLPRAIHALVPYVLSCPTYLVSYVPYVPRASYLKCLVPYVSRAIRALMSHASYVLLYLTLIIVIDNSEDTLNINDIIRYQVGLD